MQGVGPHPEDLRSITRYENLIEDCWMQEEEAHLEEEISHEQEEEEVTDAEMIDEEECGDPEPSGYHGEADTKGSPSLASTEDAVSLRRMPSSCSRDPNPKISQSQERGRYSLRRDGRFEPHLTKPTWAGTR